MTAFNGTEFMPTTVPVLHLGQTLGQAPETRQQLHFVTAKSDWRIEFEPHRIAFTKNNIHSSEIGTPEEFLESVDDYCSRVLSVLECKANRLAFVTKGILPEMEAQKISGVYSKLLSPPKFYLENESIEWATRNAASFSSQDFGENEKYNVITDINCIRLAVLEEGVQKETPRIEIGFDINTNQKNTQPRFGAKDVRPFLNEAVGVRNQILREIEGIIL